MTQRHQRHRRHIQLFLLLLALSPSGHLLDRARHNGMKGVAIAIDDSNDLRPRLVKHKTKPSRLQRLQPNGTRGRLQHAPIGGRHGELPWRKVLRVAAKVDILIRRVEQNHVPHYRLKQVGSFKVNAAQITKPSSTWNTLGRIHFTALDARITYHWGMDARHIVCLDIYQPPCSFRKAHLIRSFFPSEGKQVLVWFRNARDHLRHGIERLFRIIC